MALTLKSVTPTYASMAGGERLIVYGSFTLGVVYTVTLGGVACYSGVPSQGTGCYSYDGQSLRCYTPPVSSGQSADVAVTTAQGDAASLTRAVYICKPFYDSEVFSIRSVLPVDYNTGPRNLGQLDAVEAQ
jgi:hypothetical protein